MRNESEMYARIGLARAVGSSVPRRVIRAEVEAVSNVGRFAWPLNHITFDSSKPYTYPRPPLNTPFVKTLAGECGWVDGRSLYSNTFFGVWSVNGNRVSEQEYNRYKSGNLEPQHSK